MKKKRGLGVCGGGGGGGDFTQRGISCDKCSHHHNQCGAHSASPNTKNAVNKYRLYNLIIHLWTFTVKLPVVVALQSIATSSECTQLWDP